MRKFLPLIIFGVAVIFFIGVFLVIKGRNNASTEEPIAEEETVAEIPFDQRPFTSLTPKSDGHWLTLSIKGIKVSAVTLDYELLYKTKQGTTQGVPGTVILDGNDITRELLLGSESSGKFRYDEGVEEGTLTLRFRNDKGKLVGKLVTDFHLQTATDKLTTKDGKLTFTLSKSLSKVYFVTMSTFGVPASLPSNPKVGPYGVFGSDSTKYSGTVNLGDGEYYLIDGTKVTKISPSQSTSIGVFAAL